MIRLGFIVALAILSQDSTQAFADRIRPRLPIWSFTADSYLCIAGCSSSQYSQLPYVKPALPPLDPRRQSYFVDQSGAQVLGYLSANNQYYIIDAWNLRAYRRGSPLQYGVIEFKNAANQTVQIWEAIDRTRYRRLVAEYACTSGCQNFPDQVPPTVRIHQSDSEGQVSWRLTNQYNDSVIGTLSPDGHHLDIRDPVGRWRPSRVEIVFSSVTILKFVADDGTTMQWQRARPLSKKRSK